VSISTNVVSSNHDHIRCTWYNIMWYSLSVTCDRQGFTSVSSTNKTDRHDIAAVFLKVVLNTIAPSMNHVQNIAHEPFSFKIIVRSSWSSNLYIIALMWSSDECVSPLNSICQEYWYAYSSPPFIPGDTISREFNKDEAYF
jgi:hypothetical protein